MGCSTCVFSCFFCSLSTASVACFINYICCALIGLQGLAWNSEAKESEWSASSSGLEESLCASSIWLTRNHRLFACLKSFRKLRFSSGFWRWYGILLWAFVSVFSCPHMSAE